MILSIIVPVYNVEKYLERCVDSLIDQNLDIEDYEIILVNDGSTDDSQKVAECLVDKYSNVSLYCQENRGLSGARNTGMRHAKGKYFLFVDSDDYLEKNCLKHLIDVSLENNLDICHFSLISVRDWGSFRGKIGSLKYNTLYSGTDILREGHLIGSACSNLYRSAFLHANDLFFHEGITHEDVEFTTRLFCHCPKVMLVNDIVYYYIYNSQSLSKDKKNFEKENKYVCDAAIIGRLAKEYVNNNITNRVIKDLVVRRVNTSVVGNLYSLLRTPKRSVEIVENLLNAYRENNLYPVKGNFLNWKSRLLGYVLNNERLYMFLYKYQRRRNES